MPVVRARGRVCMTGTPLRSDGRKIPLLKYQEIVASDGRRGFQVEADYSFPYQKAVTAGIARKIICRSQDPEITYTVEKDGASAQYCMLVSHVPSAYLPAVKNTAFCFTRGVFDDS